MNVMLLLAFIFLAFALPSNAQAAAKQSPGESELPSDLASRIDSYLASRGSPMAGSGAAFVSSGARWQIDPRLLVAIAGAESSFGSITCAPFNGWGWGCPNGPYNFTSWAEGIEAVSRGLRTNYLNEGRTSVALIHAKYAPVGAANDPTGLNSNWTINVSRFLIELGGNPSDVDISDGSTMQGLPLGPLVAVGTGISGGGWSADVEPDNGKTDVSETKMTIGASKPVKISLWLKNSGWESWTPANMRLRRVDIDRRITGTQFAVLRSEEIKTGKRAEFVADLAPVGSQEGLVVTRWQAENEDGLFGAVVEYRIDLTKLDVAMGRRTISAPDAVRRGDASAAIIRVENIGETPWTSADTELFLVNSRDVQSMLMPDRWIDPTHPSSLLERQVMPGEWGSFAVPIDLTTRASTSFNAEFVVEVGSVRAAGENLVIPLTVVG